MGSRFVERLSMVDGVVVAVGYCHPSDFPQIVFDGLTIQRQDCIRFRRLDVENRDGPEYINCGFRIAALTDPSDIKDNSRLAVRFSDGVVARRNLPNIMDAHVLMNDFAADVAAHPGSSMIEIGSRARSGTVYKSKFPSLGKYVGMDVTDGPNVDVTGDAHRLSACVQEQFDYAFSVSTFEHLIMPWVAAYEIGKVMRDGGLIYIQSHPTYPLHEEPWDFFRFSTDAWKGLFNKLTGFEIVKTGYSLETSIVPLNAANGALQGMDKSKGFLVSACMARKIGEPSVNWACDPSTIIDINYSHAARQ